MSNLNQTPSANRIHIGFFGKRNSGKSSLINAFVNQDVSIVSNVAGTTTDPVYKAMEIQGIGPCVLIDTAGFDDVGDLGNLRNEKTKKISEKIDLAIIIFSDKITIELSWWQYFKDRHIPTIPVINKIDLEIKEEIIDNIEKSIQCKPLLISTKTKQGIDELKTKIIANVSNDYEKESILGNLIKSGDLVILVMPQDIQAPKGRLILPQVQVIRELLDKKCIPVATTVDTLTETLTKLNQMPDLVIADSQVFKYVYENIPKNCKLTSFSVLMAGYKGDLSYYIESVNKLKNLNKNAKILIAECCSHVPANEDIGRIKIPRMLKQRYSITNIDFVNGNDFPNDLTKYDLIIICGGCMFNRRHIMSRVEQAKNQNVAMTNYGVLLAYANDILDKIVYLK
ncbi:MAG: [FeFe] hydrogenase H-cluster maturation GTPase HydF [[Clostridium] spiroforme]|uniref:[FeFe] hydrogenase H-cluster maturation GTPase HydF n=1 Tax=Thomasclavelia spiroformis TaxID=29348 RepID=A0A943EIU8_9FIRM|nr:MULTISPECIES: [FeFe] hydrogenase H-cluster maturation GTPase HydF [Thomasclavelia]MBS5587191.1 [FeFe] hydrogenase H-cluster maturation GTPase HydF [Thomasclavelia spiroformis]